MERAYERMLGTALVVIGLAILLFGVYQIYTYAQSPPSGTYQIFNLSGTGGNGSPNFNGSFNGIILVTVMFLLVEFFVSASILKAGWNLLAPEEETILVPIMSRSS